MDVSIRKGAKAEVNVFKKNRVHFLSYLQRLGINQDMQCYVLLDTKTPVINTLSISLFFNLSKLMDGSNYTG